LKGGSSVGIPSPPAVWVPDEVLGRRVLVPSIEAAERLQGFPTGWTAPAVPTSSRRGVRWKLTGNAVTVGVSEWLGRRIRNPGEPFLEGAALQTGERWPKAAFGGAGKVWAVDVSMWPVRRPYRHLRDVVKFGTAAPLSHRAAAGFHSRAARAQLRFAEGFLADIDEHARFMSGELSVA
jgi:DNA (cytosine-5)-methyltransferase 1